MKKVSSENIEIPEKCPPNCRFREDLALCGQSSICGRCPVLLCPDVIEPEGYNADWAREWATFFQGGPEPELRFKVVELKG